MSLRPKTIQDAADAAGTGLTVPTSGKSGVALEISGTFSATITIQGTITGVNWNSIEAQNLSDGTWSATITGEGLFWVPAPGLKAIRANITSYSSGEVTIESGATDIPYSPTAS